MNTFKKETETNKFAINGLRNPIFWSTSSSQGPQGMLESIPAAVGTGHPEAVASQSQVTQKQTTIPHSHLGRILSVLLTLHACSWKLFVVYIRLEHFEVGTEKI